MKIIAGLEQPTQGDVVWSPGYSVGYLPQDPPLDADKTVKQNVQEGVQHVYDALKEYDEINVKFGLEEYYSDPDKMDKLMQRQAEIQDISSMPQTHGTWILNWIGPWQPCVVLRVTCP